MQELGDINRMNADWANKRRLLLGVAIVQQLPMLSLYLYTAQATVLVPSYAHTTLAQTGCPSRCLRACSDHPHPE